MVTTTGQPSHGPNFLTGWVQQTAYAERIAAYGPDPEPEPEPEEEPERGYRYDDAAATAAIADAIGETIEGVGPRYVPPRQQAMAAYDAIRERPQATPEELSRAAKDARNARDRERRQDRWARRVAFGDRPRGFKPRGA